METTKKYRCWFVILMWVTILLLWSCFVWERDHSDKVGTYPTTSFPPAEILDPLVVER